ncbi:choice-of-anchor L domain-containing protein [candidate division KSB1 bacterium]
MKSNYLRILYVLLLIIVPFPFQKGFAQLVTNTTMTPQQLVQNVLIGQGVTISNVTFNSPSGAQNIGHFSALNTNLGLDSGVIIASGRVSNAIGPNNTQSAGNQTFTGSDPQLAALMPGYSIFDAAVLEFDFVPLSDTIRFNYIFGSEEYPEWVSSPYNDVFGFFISGANPAGGNYNNYNIALIPGTTLPVCIDNVNNVIPSYPQYYVNNNGGLTIQYDGFTTVFTAWAKVTPCSTYHMKLAVADAGDMILDSGVFLEKNSFSSSIPNVSISYTNPTVDTMAVEGCNDAIISFKLPQIKTSNTNINISVFGSATNGTDFPVLPTVVTIPAGLDSAALVITPFLDSLVEGTESITIVAQTTPCTADTVTVYIRDNSPLQCIAPADTNTCGNPVNLLVSETGGIPPYIYTWSTGDTINNIQVNPVVQTTYFVTVSDQCGSTAVDSVTIFIGGNGSVYAGPDSIICDSNSYLISGASAQNINTLFWTTSGSGTISNNGTLNPLYTPSVYDIGAGFVVLTLTGDTNSICGSVSDSMILTIVAGPKADAGNDTIICEGDNLTLIGANASNYSTLLWTTSGTGTILNNTTLVPTYVPSAADIAAGSVVLTLNVTGNPPCSVQTDTITVTINPKPYTSLIYHY